MSGLTFDAAIEALRSRYPGVVELERGQHEGMACLFVRSRERTDGFAVITELVRSGLLIELFGNSTSDRIEEWGAHTVEELAAAMGDWILPSRWRAPPPLDVLAETEKLTAIAEGIAARGQDGARVDVALEGKGLGSDARREVNRLVRAVDSERLVMAFPHDERGRLALGTTVLLSILAPAKVVSTQRSVCAVATGPARRRDTATITVHVESRVAYNLSHRWDDAPWLWSDVPKPEVSRLGSPRCTHGEANATAVEALDRLDAGDLEGALGLYGLGVGRDVHKLIGGLDIAPPHNCSQPDEEWNSAVVGAIRASAPWRMAAHVACQPTPRRATRARLINFPGQPHTTKAGLYLMAQPGGAVPHLALDLGGNQARLQHGAWRRPIEVDFDRFGVPLPG